MHRIMIGEETFLCPEDKDLLKAARSQRVQLPFGCASGGCGLCKIKVIKGDYEVDVCSKDALSDEEREQGYALLCKTYPYSPLEAELAE